MGVGVMPVQTAQNEMRLEIMSRPENVGLARVAVAAFAGQLDFTLGDLEEIKVAVSEAVSNSVLHAYEDPTGRIEVTVRIDGPVLEIVVEDWGKGIPDVDEARQPAFSTDPERMGLGFVFIESFMDEVEVRSQPGAGTVVRMRKECRAPAVQ